jgi:hypothetical protein
MKEKLAQARAKGRHGWHECPPEELSRMLRAHVEKGDPRDVANFCMFLWSLGHPISDAPVAQEPDVVLRVVHSGHEVADPEVVKTSKQFDSLLAGTEVALFTAPVAAQPTAIDALRNLESACDALCVLRTQEQYLSMIDSGQKDALQTLDHARAQARRVLAAPVAAQPSVPSIEAAKKMGMHGGPILEEERLAFEAWMEGHCWALCATWDGKTYMGLGESPEYFNSRAMLTRQLWAAWRDRGALATKQEQS